MSLLAHPVIDRVTQAPRYITTDHSNIHDGEGFVVTTYTESVSLNGTLLLQFAAPASGYVHLKRAQSWTTASKALFEIIEAPTLTTGTTSVVPVNKRRVGTPAASGSVLFSDPTGISDGTTLEAALFGNGGAGANAHGGMRSLDEEWVLKPSTTYIFRVTNKENASRDLSLYLFWYEEGEG